MFLRIEKGQGIVITLITGYNNFIFTISIINPLKINLEIPLVFLLTLF